MKLDRQDLNLLILFCLPLWSWNLVFGILRQPREHSNVIDTLEHTWNIIGISDPHGYELRNDTGVGLAPASVLAGLGAFMGVIYEEAWSLAAAVGIVVLLIIEARLLTGREDDVHTAAYRREEQEREKEQEREAEREREQERREEQEREREQERKEKNERRKDKEREREQEWQKEQERKAEQERQRQKEREAERKQKKQRQQEREKQEEQEREREQEQEAEQGRQRQGKREDE
ncbi:hypothetical protein B484DRAFT_461260, partial [Ochromonadaceae sp. CCMP2298]